MKRFWLTVAHIAVMGAGAAAVIFFPPAAVFIVPAVGTLNGLIPSPAPEVAKAVGVTQVEIKK